MAKKLVLWWLRFWARVKLARVRPTIIGVTGSAGKTSTVAAIAAALAQKFSVKTTGGANSESGIPLAILDLKMQSYSVFDWLRVLVLAPASALKFKIKNFQFLVCEMGVDELTPPKNMGYLLSIVQPKIGVFLNVLPAHTLQMKNLANIAAEKGKLITSLPAGGTAILNQNDRRVAAFKNRTRAKTVFFDGSSLGAANAVAKLFSLVPIASFAVPPGRGRIFSGINGSTIIDSSYNASPGPVLAALEQLKNFKGRRVAVLGDMRELGGLAARYHREVAKKAYASADAVIAVGPLCQKFFPKDKKLVARFPNSFSAGEFLRGFIKKGDTVLFKGSQNTIFLEAAVAMCLANKTDESSLCRRGSFWDKQRAVSAAAG